MEERKSHQILTEGINPDKSHSSSQSGISISLSREDILAVYEEGPEAVCAIIMLLAARIAELEERVNRWRIKSIKTAAIAANLPRQMPSKR